MNICFLETFIENGDIAFIRGKFCYDFYNSESNESVTFKREFEEFSTDHTDKYFYKFLYYFKDMDYIIGLNIDYGVKILLRRLELIAKKPLSNFVFHSDFKVIDLATDDNSSFFFGNIPDNYSSLSDYPYDKEIEKCEKLAYIFKTLGGEFEATVFKDTDFVEFEKVMINEKHMPKDWGDEGKVKGDDIGDNDGDAVVPVVPVKIVKNHFNLLKNGCRGFGRFKDLSRGKDSKFVLEPKSFGNINASYKKDRELREAFLKIGKIEYSDYYMYIKEELLFNSPKDAADFLFGNSKGSNEYWIDEDLHPVDVENISKYSDEDVILDLLNAYYLKDNLVDAKGIFVHTEEGNKFVVLKGSKGRKSLNNSFKVTNSLVSKWKDLIKNELLFIKGDYTIASQDIEFASAREAACIFQGIRSGKSSDWIDKNGNPFVENSTLAVTSFKTDSADNNIALSPEKQQLWNQYLDEINELDEKFQQFLKNGLIAGELDEEIIVPELKTVGFNTLSKFYKLLGDLKIKLITTEEKKPNPDLIYKPQYNPEELKVLSDEQANYFVHSGLDRLSFYNLTTLSESAASIIANFQGGYLGFPSMDKVSGGTLSVLCNGYKGYELDLSGLTKGSEYRDNLFTHFEGNTLNLSGIESLTDSLVYMLKNCKCKTIVLKGLKSIKQADLNELESNGVEIVLNDNANIIDDLSEYVEDGALGVNIPNLHDFVDQLASYDGDKIDITLEDGKLYIDDCLELVKFKGKHLSIEGIKYLPPKCAEILATFKGDTLQIGIMDGAFNVNTLKYLVQFGGDELIVSGFSRLWDGEPETLASFKGKTLSLYGELTDEQIEYIENNFDGNFNY